MLPCGSLAGSGRASIITRRGEQLSRGVGVLAAGALLATLTLAAAGCGAGGPTSPVRAASERHPLVCPKAWRAGWQKLANTIHAPVFCPSWLPQPLEGGFGGPFFNGRFVDPDRSYLVSFVWFDTGGPVVNEVHVNLRGYPGNGRIPTCEDTLTVQGKTVHKKFPCFSDARSVNHFGPMQATLYTANRGADLWHVLYAWHRNGSLYSLSEHVAPPYSYAQVIRNLDRMMRRLVLVQPATQP